MFNLHFSDYPFMFTKLQVYWNVFKENKIKLKEYIKNMFLTSKNALMVLS